MFALATTVGADEAQRMLIESIRQPDCCRGMSAYVWERPYVGQGNIARPARDAGGVVSQQ